MAAALKADLDVEATLVKGSGGIFEIAVDGVVVSKKSVTGFPTEKDVVDAVSVAL